MSQGERSVSDLAQENSEGDAADGAAVGCRPAEGKATLARFSRAAADIQYVFGSQRSGWRTWRPSQQVRGFGFGFWQDLGPRREAPFFFFCSSLAARRFQVEPDSWKWRPFSFSVFLDYAYKRAYRWLLAERRCGKKRDEVD